MRARNRVRGGVVQPARSRADEPWRRGVRDSLPFATASFVLSLSFGVVAVESGFSPLAAVVMSADRAKALGLKPRARFVTYAVAGVPPEIMGIGPVEAVPKALKQAGLALADIDLIELNEAFATQALAVMEALGLDPAKVNVNGGAIAIGHPIGASGARVLTTLLHEMKRTDASKGLATLCVGGGMGVALCVEKI